MFHVQAYVFSDLSIENEVCDCYLNYFKEHKCYVCVITNSLQWIVLPVTLSGGNWSF